MDIDIQLYVKRLQDANWTNCKVEIEFTSSSSAGNNGEAYNLLYWQHDDGGANLATFRIDTLYQALAGSNKIDTIYVDTVTDSTFRIVMPYNSGFSGTYYWTGEVVYGRNIDSALPPYAIKW